jgi:ribosomal protein L16 Arg81 hydroxylase
VESQAIELRPGSVLFLPRGYWHQTEVLEDSLALNLALLTPTWHSVFLGQLRNLLLNEAHWRAPALRWSDEQQTFLPPDDDVAALLSEWFRDSSMGAIGEKVRGMVQGMENRRPRLDSASTPDSGHVPQAREPLF